MVRSWGELGTRAWQEVCKRCDLARYHLGIPFNWDIKSSRAKEHPRFFFEWANLPGLVTLLRERLPQQAQETVRRAELICTHEFDLLGYQQLKFGPQIDWHLEIVHGKRSPFKPWFRIRFLDFEEVGDAKIIWELNRHQHLTTLARAYQFTGEQRFAEEAFRQWYDWWKANPYPIGINWASSLEVALRSLSWLWLQRLLEHSPTTPKCFPDDLLCALGISGRHIERYLSTYFSPNTHLLGEGVALFFIGTLCPQISAAKRWQRLGWEIVLRESERQVQTDGMHFEQSVYYHVYAVDFLLHARMLAVANQISMPKSFDQTLERMLEVLFRLSQGGVPPRFGDDDGGRVFDPHRNRNHHLTDPLAIGAALFNRADFKAIAGISEEMVWLLGQEGVANFDRLPTVIPEISSIGLQSSGMYVMGGEEPIQKQIVIDAGPLGADRGGHGHADALSLCMVVDGREWLVDPGTFTYISDGMDRDHFRGTAAHNTLRVDRVDQAEPSEPFAWRTQPEVRVENWIVGESFDLLIASHTGYRRLPAPVLHRRCVLNLKSLFCLVLDIAEGEGIHRLELSWHFRPGSFTPTETYHGVHFKAEDQSTFAVLTLEGHDWKREIREGWYSPVYGRKEPCLVLHLEKKAQLPAEFVTLLRPGFQTFRELGRLEAIRTIGTDRSVRGYVYSVLQESHYVFFAAQSCRWKLGRWASDASFLYCSVSPSGCLRQLVTCGGSFVEMDGRRVFSARHTVACFEWVQNGAAGRMFCSDKNAIEFVPGSSALNLEVALSSDRGPDHDQGAS